MEVTLAGTGYTDAGGRQPDRAAGFRRQIPARWLAARRHLAHGRALSRQGRQGRRAGGAAGRFDLRPPAPAGRQQPQNPEPKTQIQEPARFALVATGNPGRIYRVDLAQFAPAGVNADQISDPKTLAEKGITVFGEIRDRNVRRLARLADGRIAAGSAPHGNVYVFPAGGGAPMILQENREAEVTDLLPQPNGDLYATIVFSAASGENRITRPGLLALPAAVKSPPSESPVPVPIPPAAGNEAPGGPPPEEPLRPENPRERFAGRSQVVFFPADGFPEMLLERSGLAFYRLARRGDLLLMAAGEKGEMLAWDLKNRLSLTLPGAEGAQLNALVPLPGNPDRFLLLQNNAPGLALLDFAGSGPRQLETKRLDFGLPAELGNLRFESLRDLAPETAQVEARTSFGSDEAEGWSEWTRLAVRDGAFYAAGLRGRYVKLRITVPAGARDFALDTATLYGLPQDRPPVLTAFHLLPPNYRSTPPRSPFRRRSSPSGSCSIPTSRRRVPTPRTPSARWVSSPASWCPTRAARWRTGPSPTPTATRWPTPFPSGAPASADWTDLAVGHPRHLRAVRHLESGGRSVSDPPGGRRTGAAPGGAAPPG